MEIKLYFHMLRRSWWVVVLTFLVAIASALIYSFITAPTFLATARYIVSPNPAYFVGSPGNVISSLDTLDRPSVMTTYAEILSSSRISSEAFALLNMTAAEQVDYTTSALVLPDTNIIEFSSQGPDPATAALVANTIGEKAVQYITGIYQLYDITLLDKAVPPTVPISPQPLRDAGVASVVGLALGVALALFRELLRTPINDFIEQRKLDITSLALSHTTFEENLDKVAFASTTDFSLCIVHLDGLAKYINILPESTLEVILRHVTQVHRNQLRGNDLVGRWNDVDFAVLLSDTQGDAALNTMSRVQAALSIPIKIDISGEDLFLKPKIGIAEYRVLDTTESLVANTYWALEMAKENSGIYLLKATQPI